MLDPIVATTRAAGRRLRLSHLLRLNGQKGKAGAECDALGLWQEGKLDALERYCMRDVEALAELALRDEVRVPGGSTREATVWQSGTCFASKEAAASRKIAARGGAAR